VATGGTRLEQWISHKPDWAVQDLTTVTPAQVIGVKIEGTDPKKPEGPN